MADRRWTTEWRVDRDIDLSDLASHMNSLTGEGWEIFAVTPQTPERHQEDRVAVICCRDREAGHV